MGAAPHCLLGAWLMLVCSVAAPAEPLVRIEYGKVKEVLTGPDYAVLFMYEIDPPGKGGKDPVVARTIAMETLDQPHTIVKDIEKDQEQVMA